LIQAIQKTTQVPRSVKNQLLQLQNKIAGLHHFKNTYELDLPQAEFLQHGFQSRWGWLISYGPIVRQTQLPHELFFYVTSFLAPKNLGQQQLEDLLVKVHRNAVLEQLNRYLNRSMVVNLWKTGTLYPVHYQRAQSLSKAMQQQQRLNQLGQLIFQQHQLFQAVNQPNVDGQTPLIMAVEQKNHEQAEQLLIQGAHPDQPEQKNQTTPLMNAVAQHDDDMIQLLLNYDARTDIQDNHGNNAYHWAIWHQADTQITKALDNTSTQSRPKPHETPLAQYNKDSFYTIINGAQWRLDNNLIPSKPGSMTNQGRQGSALQQQSLFSTEGNSNQIRHGHQAEFEMSNSGLNTNNNDR
jgi:hypothetical protein